jgi:hypothetical protein
VFGVGGDSGSSMSTNLNYNYSMVNYRVCCSWRLPWCSISVLVSAKRARQFLVHHAYTCLQWEQRQSDPHKPARYVFSCLYLHTHTLARPSLSGAKYPIHLACLRCPQDLQKLMESSVPSSELPSKCPVVTLTLKATNLATKTLASLNISGQGPRFCRL